MDNIINFHWFKKYHLIYLNTVDSTNSYAIKYVNTTTISKNIIIVAREQFDGRGRFSKSWISDVGNLHCSVIIKNDIPKQAEQNQLSIVTAVALWHAVNFFLSQSLFNFNLSIKWPNDIFVNDKKVGGVLIESINKLQNHYFIIGIGLNLISNPNIPNTTNLLNQGLCITNIFNIINVLIYYLTYYIKIWNTKNFPIIKQLWLNNAYQLGKIITISNSEKTFSGKFDTIDDYGSIILTNNNIHYIFSNGSMIL